ncbi:MAG: ribulose-phosphate 3-epimerase [Acidobacteriota bacterium]|jgi:ribulose-phosphate 3-epimerase
MTETKSRIKGLAPSILSADFADLAGQIRLVAPHSRMLHVDVMDGHFVPNITLGPPVVRSLRKATELPLDCHLMIEAPDRYLSDFAEAGADYLSVHQETCPHLHRTITRIREQGMRPGVVVNPATPIETLDEILPFVDYVLVMSVNPGFGGQKFIPAALGKIRRLREKVSRAGLKTAIEVDGGVDPETVPPLLEAGADWFVSGSAVFHSPDPGAAAALLSELIHA